MAGAIHRTARHHTTAGSKAVNAARAAATLGAPVLAIGPAGGASGRHLAGLASVEDFDSRWFDIAGSTRICTLIVSEDGDEETVVNEEGPTLGWPEWEGFLDLYERHVGGAEVVILSGSLPAGVPADAYGTLVERAGGRPVLLDGRGRELLDALPARPAWVHLNAGELALTFPGESDPRRSARELVALGARNVVLTDGAGPVLLAGASGAWRIVPPRVRPVKRIGCGDALVGALAAAVLGALPSFDGVDLVARAVAAPSAAAAAAGPAPLDPARAAREQRERPPAPRE